MKKYHTSIELLKEIEAWLSFNKHPSRIEILKLRTTIKEHLQNCNKVKVIAPIFNKK